MKEINIIVLKPGPTGWPETRLTRDWNRAGLMKRPVRELARQNPVDPGKPSWDPAVYILNDVVFGFSFLLSINPRLSSKFTAILIFGKPSLSLALSYLGSQDCKNGKKQFVNLNNSICHTPSCSLPLFLHMFPNRSSPLSPPRRLVTQIFTLNLLQFYQISWLRSWFQACWWPKLALQRYGQYLYDGLILFSPSIESKLLNWKKLLFIFVKFWFLWSCFWFEKMGFVLFTFFSFLGMICDLGNWVLFVLVIVRIWWCIGFSCCAWLCWLGSWSAYCGR